MLQEDLEKRLEDIECKIQELEDMVLENKLKIMDIKNKESDKKNNPGIVHFDKPEKDMDIPPPPPSMPENRDFVRKVYEPKHQADEEMDSLKDRAKKIKNMLRDLK